MNRKGMVVPVRVITIEQMQSVLREVRANLNDHQGCQMSLDLTQALIKAIDDVLDEPAS